jgi:ribonuclease Z
MSMIKPRLAVAYHFFNDFDTRYPIIEGIRRTYDGPLTMATDLLVWNVTKKDIRVRQAIVDEESWPAKSPTKPDEPDTKAKVEFTTFLKDGKLDMSKTLGPLMEKFKKENNLK